MKIEKKIKVSNEYGLHSRPSLELVKLAKQFESDIFLYKVNDKTTKADCKSIFSILLLGAVKGTELILSGSGPDIEKAIREITKYFKRNFDEAL